MNISKHFSILKGKQRDDPVQREKGGQQLCSIEAMEQQMNIPEGYHVDLKCQEAILQERNRDIDRFLESLPERYRQERGKILKRAEPVGSSVFRIKEASRLMPDAISFLQGLDAEGVAAPSGMIFTADTLSSARGRMERRWHAASGGIYIALCFVPELLPSHHDLYPLVPALSIAQVLQAHGVNAEIRWINDVLIARKKVSGVLMEQISLAHSREQWIICGIGVNVNQEKFPRELPSATSLRMETGGVWDREMILAKIIARTSLNLALLHQWECMLAEEAISIEELREMDEEPAPIIQPYRSLCSFLGNRVIYGQDADRRPEAIALARGIMENGHLMLEMEDGATITVGTGEIRFY